MTDWTRVQPEPDLPEAPDLGFMERVDGFWGLEDGGQQSFSDYSISPFLSMDVDSDDPLSYLIHLRDDGFVEFISRSSNQIWDRVDDPASAVWTQENIPPSTSWTRRQN